MPRFLSVFLRVSALIVSSYNPYASGTNSVSCNTDKSPMYPFAGFSIKLVTVMLIVHEEHIKIVNRLYFQAGREK